MFPWAFRHLPGPQQELFRYQEAVRGLIRQEITAHQLRGPGAPKDFISCYLAQMAEATDDPVSTFNEDNLIQVVTDLFLGGTDTTATTLRWALFYMVQHGAIQGEGPRVHLALLRPPGASGVWAPTPLLGSGAPGWVLLAPMWLSKCSWLWAGYRALCSSLSHPSSPLQGTIILPNLASVLHDPECWETPRQFNPGHFLDKDGNFVVNEAFLPFSAGHRVCPGEQLARMELFLMFATLLRTFRFQLPEGSPGLRLESVFGGTLQPQPQKICAVPRLSEPSPRHREAGL
ncbi:putative cytochrome P450 2D7 [Tupaia chinensis]|uniref:putative cytochrome P450 2D7 n=1 Tax=Tupaia chinensis TaxID=246437 RepID=UPI0007041765|nr:putative cytochrome P450 2D7 [Tupaia chinensis]